MIEGNIQLINFDEGDAPLSLQSIHFVHRKNHYVLIEALSDAVAKWRNSQMAGTRMEASESSDKRTITLGNMGDAEPVLVSLCAFYSDENGTIPVDGFGNVDLKKRVPEQVVRSWTNRVVSRLFEQAKLLSNLEETETVESLDKKIKELQARHQKLVKAKETHEEDLTAKN